MVCVHSKVDKIQMLADDLFDHMMICLITWNRKEMYIQAQKKISSWI